MLNGKMKAGFFTLGWDFPSMAVIEQGSFEIISRSPSQTRRVGMRLGDLLQAGDIVGLVGNLGSGKTTFVQGLASGWGSLDAVSSPTYVLVNIYRRMGGGELFHLDAYRLQGPAEAVDLDLDGMIERGPLVIEWADRIAEALPDHRLTLKMKMISADQRDFIIQAQGDRHRELLRQFRERIYGES